MRDIKVDIHIKPKDYSISIGYDMILTIADKISNESETKKIVIITDSNIKDSWGKELVKAFNELGREVFLVYFSAGEANKTRKTKENIENELFKHKCGRDIVLIALGGGVVGDVAGFVASTYMRGVTFYQIPTTVLAQADSSIGGKTGIDVEYGKNLIGSFYHPKKVFIDTKFLTTLEHEIYLDGLVEVIKHGIIYDYEFYLFIKQNLKKILERDAYTYEEVLPEILHKNCSIKRDIVSKDPFETGLRKILNFGHTIGHAVELLSNYSISHGRAVAIGIVCEAFIGWKVGITKKEVYEEICRVVKDLGLSERIPENILPEKIYEAMILDKKSRGGLVEFVIIKEIGVVCDEITIPLDKEKVIEFLNEYIKI